MQNTKQDAEARAVDPAVVGDHGQSAGALLVQGRDERPRDAGQPEAPDGDARPVGDVPDGLGRTGHELVHVTPLLRGAAVVDRRGP